MQSALTTAVWDILLLLDTLLFAAQVQRSAHDSAICACRQ